MSLRNFLAAQLATLAPPPNVEVADLLAPASGAPPTVTLFLYEVDEDDCARNAPPTQARVGGVVVRQRAPVTLRLRYLLTVWADDLISAHTILGRVVQVFHDDAIIQPPALAGSLAIEDQAIKVRLAPLTLEERTRIWNAVQLQYRLSLTYEVRVVRIESERSTSGTPVASRTTDVGTGG